MRYVRTARWALGLLVVVGVVCLVLGWLEPAALGRQTGPASWPQRLALWCASPAALVALLVAGATAGAGAASSAEAASLEDELAQVERSDEFQSRMELLARPGSSGGRWRLRLVRVTARRWSHTSFEAMASRDDEKVLLWGKRYRWMSFLRALQRGFLPSYESATWGILCAMHARGMDAPVPIVRHRLRKAGLRAGGLVLVEHVGPTTPLKGFVCSRFALLPAEERAALLARLAGFVNELHAAGVYDFTPRYFRLQNADAGPEKMKLYLFDLDKAHLLRRAPGFVRRYARTRGLRRLRRLFRRYATADELAAFERELAERPGRDGQA